MQLNKGKRQSSIEKRVARGAAWLDRVKPGWFKLIDLDALDLRSGCSCVLGQIVYKEARACGAFACGKVTGYGSVVVRDHKATGAGRWGSLDYATIQTIEVRKAELSNIDNLKDLVIPGITAKRRGFELTKSQEGDSAAEWDALTDEWRAVIEAKLEEV